MNIFNKSWKRKYSVIWIGQTISLFTSAILQMSIVWYLTLKTNSAAVLSMATLIGYLPGALLGLFIGTFIDRHSHKKTMIVADLFIAFVGLILAVVSFFQELPIWLIMVVLLLRSIGSAFHYPALLATTPSLVPQEKLTKFSGISQSLESLSMVLSPALAGVLFSLVNLTYIIFLDVIGAFIAVLALMVVEIPKVIRTIEKTSFIKDTIDGFKELKRVKGMLALMIIGALYAIIYFPIGTLYPFITMEYFKGTISQSGIVETLFSVGTLIGSLFIGLMGEKIAKIPAMITSIFVYGLGVLITGLLPQEGMLIFMVISLIIGIFVPLHSSIEIAIFQINFKQEYLGRIFSLSSSVLTFTMPIGLILAGALVDKIGINVFFMIAGILSIGLSILTLSIPSLRKLK